MGSVNKLTKVETKNISGIITKIHCGYSTAYLQNDKYQLFGCGSGYYG
jgi:hypothetical protein